LEHQIKSDHVSLITRLWRRDRLGKEKDER